MALLGKEELRPYQIRRIVRVAAPLWLNLSARTLKLTLDGIAQSEEAVLVAVSNGAYLGEGMPIAPDARLNDGLFDVVIVGPMTRRELPKFARALWNGSHLSLPNVRVAQAQRVEIRRVDGRLRPLHVHADDRIVGETPAHFEVLCGALRIFAPAPNGENFHAEALS